MGTSSTKKPTTPANEGSVDLTKNEAVNAGASAGNATDGAGTAPDNSNAATSTVADIGSSGTSDSQPKVALPFPREMQLINETATNYTVGRKYLPAHGGTATLRVTDEDHRTRLNTDCAELVRMNGSYKDADPDMLPLRLEELPD